MAGDIGRRGPLPEGVEVKVMREDGDTGQYVRFWPDGRGEVARIEVVRGENRMGVVCEGPAERFRVASNEEMRGWR